MSDYFGKYINFETISKKDAVDLLGADNAVGDIYDINIEFEDGAPKAWLDNKFNQRIGYLNGKDSRRVSLCQADGLICKAVLSFVAFTNHPDEGHYWGSVAVICYNPAYEDEFGIFIKGLSEKIGDDVRPRIDFDKDGVDKILESDGHWLPTQTISLPDTNEGMAIIKRRRRMLDKMIDQGRSRNIGCYIASWTLILVLVALILFGLKGCFGW